MHYAKCVLSHMLHCYLTVKWIKNQMIQETPPEIVLNFIVQWIDNENFHFFDDVNHIVCIKLVFFTVLLNYLVL